MSNSYGRQVVLPLTNKSGGGVIAGDVVIVDTTNNDSFTTTASAGSLLAIGVAQETIASNAVGRVLVQGYAALVNVNASVTRGNYGKTHTVAKQATDAGASRAAGTFLLFLTGGTTPTALVFPVDLAGAALTNPMTAVGDLIKGGASGAPTALALTVPAANILEVLGVVNGETTPTWKAVHDGTAPAAVGAAAAGTALTASHRDHVHAMSTTGPTSVGANAAIGNGSYADIASVALPGAGVFLILADMQISGTAGRTITYHFINGAAAEKKIGNTTIGASGQENCSLWVIYTAAGAETFKLQAQSTGAGDVARGTTAWTNPATQIVAIQIG